MNLKPGDLFFSLIEFLGFIVPGCIICITLPYYICWEIPSSLNITVKESSAFSWLVFIIVSYVLGHFLHHISALVLNPIYQTIYLKQKIHKHYNFIELSENAIKKRLPFHSNYLKVAEAYLRIEQPSLITDLEKNEANSKLFRSLCLLSVYLCFYPQIHWCQILFLIIILFLSFSRFANQRWVYRFRIYEYFLIMTTKP